MKKLMIMALAVAAAMSVSAERVSPDMVTSAVNTLVVQNDQMGCPIKGSVSSVRLCTAANGTAFYVAKLTGGGFVVTSTDTDIDPIIAISSAPDLVEDSKNPLWVLLARDMATRHESLIANNKTRAGHVSAATPGKTSAASRWARLTSSVAKKPSVDASGAGASTGMTSISDVRVEPLLKTKWGQSNVGGQPCFNYYTPNNYLCGCTATAGAQILRYHKFPDYYVTPQTYECRVGGSVMYLNQIGGYYNWDKMPDVPSNEMTKGQREAIGKLTYDVGVAVESEYNSDVTYGYVAPLANLFIEWEYAHATLFHYSSWHDKKEKGEGFLGEELKSLLIPNLEAKLPVVVRIYDIDNEDASSHFAVADGYGYLDGLMSVHLNLGWDGDYDAWYVLPEFCADMLYTTINYILANIYPHGPESGGIVSGRVLSSSTSNPASGVTVRACNDDGDVMRTTTDTKGIYAFVLPEDDDWEIYVEGEPSKSYWQNVEDNENHYGLDFFIQASSVMPPNNDTFSTATEISGMSGTVTGTNMRATVEDGDPLTDAYDSDAIVWWKWTAPTSNTYTFSTDGSDFDTVIGVYQDDGACGLSLIIKDDDGGANGCSTAAFEAVAGETYFIAVGGYGYDVGNIVLSWTGTMPVDPAPAAEPTSMPSPVLWPETTGQGGAVQESVPADAASVYDGFLLGGSGNVAGTVQMKVTKPKDGKAKATITIQPTTGKKTMVNGTLDMASGKVDGIDLTLGADRMSGTWNGYAISGSRNLFSSKKKSEQSAADAMLKPWLGAVNVAWKSAKGWNGLSVSVAKKGKSKVSGTLADGTKVTTSSQLIVGAKWCCIPVVATKAKLSFSLWLPIAQGDAPMVDGLGLGAVAGKPGPLVGGATLGVDAAAAASAFGGAMEKYLPNGLSVSQSGTKWTVANGAKAGNVVMKNGVVDDANAGANPSGLKLTYTPKSGTFKGSFKAYAVSNEKLKAITVNVNGVMVDGQGYGTAAVKKLGCVPITVGSCDSCSR